LLLLVCSFKLWATSVPIDTLNHLKDDTNKVRVLHAIGKQFWSTGNFDSALIYLNRAQALSLQLNYTIGAARTYTYLGWVYSDQGNYAEALKYAWEALQIYTKLKYEKNICGSYIDLGIVSHTRGNYTAALDYYLKALQIAEKLKDEKSTGVCCSNVGDVYYDLHNYNGAIPYYIRAQKIYEKLADSSNIAKAYADLGRIYGEQGKNDDALKYFFLNLNIEKRRNYRQGIVISGCNIGESYRRMGNIHLANSYIVNALKLAKEINLKEEEPFLYSELAEEDMEQKKYKNVRQYLDTGLAIAKEINNKSYIKTCYYNLSRIDSIEGNYASAYKNFRFYSLYRDSLVNEESIKRLTQLELNYKFDKEKDSIKVVREKADVIKNAEIKRKSITLYSTVIILILVLISAILLVRYLQTKRKKDKLVSEREKALLLSENQRVEEELIGAKKALDDFTRNMVEKNELLEQFKLDIEKLSSLKSKELEEIKIEQLENLNKTTILTKDDWDKFRELFEEVYKGFFIRLKEKLPDLTQAEIRLICLTKLKLETRQMSSILGVSLDTIAKSRYRLRKKLGLSENDSIEDVVISI